ncbi:MFS transporter [Klebsiella quasipneumoniae]|uniref:MFS transporter n=1 Tax=Klebsiella quasipneumoniae TaxID=1463165 RepID=UPI00211432F5|nr:MFS transporter [Klebsiella quasipneumoniae]
MNRSPSVKTTGLLFIMILSALMAFTSLSTDIYLPAMPIMAKELQGDAELTITGFLIGFCLAQLIWGPISDRFGRRPPLITWITINHILTYPPTSSCNTLCLLVTSFMFIFFS